MAVYTPEIECASRDYLHAVQSARLLKMVRTAYEKVPFYKRKFDEIGLQPGDHPFHRRHYQAALHGQNRSAGQLSLWPVRCSAGGAGAYSRLLRHHR